MNECQCEIPQFRGRKRRIPTYAKEASVIWTCEKCGGYAPAKFVLLRREEYRVKLTDFAGKCDFKVNNEPAT
jgi:hypothetical protein